VVIQVLEVHSGWSLTVLGLKPGGASVTTGISAEVVAAVVIGSEVADKPDTVVEGTSFELFVSKSPDSVVVAPLLAPEDPVDDASVLSGTGLVVISSPSVID
jgi:hypothetical protein